MLRCTIVIVAIMAMLSVLASPIFANGTVPSSVAIVPQCLKCREGAWPAMNEIGTKYFSKKGFATVYGVPVQAALNKLGIQVTNGTKDHPAQAAVLDKETLLKLGDELGVDVVIAPV